MFARDCTYAILFETHKKYITIEASLPAISSSTKHSNTSKQIRLHWLGVTPLIAFAAQGAFEISSAIVWRLEKRETPSSSGP